MPTAPSSAKVLSPLEVRQPIQEDHFAGDRQLDEPVELTRGSEICQ
jgi:hypothetical protein